MKPFLSFVLFVLACACVPADALAAPLSEEELEFLQIEAWRGDADALFALGEMHEKGESGFKADKMVALCCYLPAARKGHKGAIARVKALGGNRYLPKEFRDDEHAQSEDIYIVKRGDTLPGIARTLGVSVSALEKANPEAFPNPFVGQKLKIPSPSTFVSSSVADCGNGVKMEFVRIPAGTFMMGSPTSEEGRYNDESQVRVTISRPFHLGKYEVTQAQWRAVMGTDPSKFKGDDCPVECVSWDDANAFCAKLTERERDAGRLPQNMKYTLPTEAQWEYACRAGTTTRFYTGNAESDLARAAWYDGNSGSKTHAVGQKEPNAWGLYDMHGNVYEWCADRYDSSLRGGTDPSGASSGSHRVLRGGDWDAPVRLCRSALRGYNSPGYRGGLGFRVCAVQEH